MEDSWYKGPCLAEYLDGIKISQRKPDGPVRIPVIDRFKDQGSTYVYGKVESGTIIEDQTVTILPERTQMVIKDIFNAKAEKLPFASAGENVKLRVRGEESSMERGSIICNNLNYCQESSEFKANITVL